MRSVLLRSDSFEYHPPTRDGTAYLFHAPTPADTLGSADALTLAEGEHSRTTVGCSSSSRATRLKRCCCSSPRDGWCFLR